MKILIKTIKKDFLSILSIFNLILILLSILIVVIVNLTEIDIFIERTNECINVFDALFLSFLGPGQKYTFLTMLKYILPNIIVLFVWGKAISNELEKGYLYAIFRIASKKIWWIGKILAMLISVIVYYISLVLISSMVYIYKFNFDVTNAFTDSIISTFEKYVYMINTVQPINMIIIILIINIICCFILITFQFLCSMIFKNSYWGFLASVVLILISIMSININSFFMKILPNNYSMIIRLNYITNFEMWHIKYSYILFMAIFLFVIGIKYVDKNEVFI